ncbi:hypothetical protein DPMN_090266 [Dreissena polymorpha]|uniref:Uncharacterized protein n=1 Tax=Dreissena polymorpha TaxID=45954 RepID=A0A9D4KXY0_DREPO|nr:hypothetical protein DPMN_090266 [Dreissena polymorpha]
MTKSVERLLRLPKTHRAIVTVSKMTIVAEALHHHSLVVSGIIQCLASSRDMCGICFTSLLQCGRILNYSKRPFSHKS